MSSNTMITGSVDLKTGKILLNLPGTSLGDIMAAIKALPAQIAGAPPVPIPPVPIPPVPIPPVVTPPVVIPPVVIPPVVTPPVVTPPVTPSPVPAQFVYIKVGPGQAYTQPADAIVNLVPAGTLELTAGVFAPFGIPPGLDGLTILGAGAASTIIDGQGGAGGGHRLVWGKGGIHTMSAGTIKGITFRNCGGVDRVADGEAGLYAESFAKPGLLTVTRCRFLSNENGIFIPAGKGGPGSGISLLVDQCDFGDCTPTGSNGQSQDGRSHDVYLQADGTVTFTQCRLHGNWWGNNIKVRSPALVINNGYNVSYTGSRWIDMPDEGFLTVRGGTYVLADSAIGGNVLGDGEESTANGPGLWSFAGVTFYIGRWNAEFNSAAGTTMVFDPTCKVIWGPSGASITVESAAVAGLPLNPASGGTRGSQPLDPGFIA